MSTLRKHLHLEQIPCPFRSQVAFPKHKIIIHCLLLFLICFIFKHFHPSSSKGHVKNGLISPVLRQQTSFFMQLPLSCFMTEYLSDWSHVSSLHRFHMCMVIIVSMYFLLFVNFEQFTLIYVASLLSLGIFFMLKCPGFTA